MKTICTMRLGAGLTALAAGAALFSSPARAQDANVTQSAKGASEGGLETIVVTAQRRSEDVQRAAVSIDVVSGDELQRRGVVDLSSLARVVPALQANTAAGPYPVFGMRGIYSASVNQFSDAAVATALDGVFLARPFATHGMFYDLERVEVLKGPQGTLYGRNATGGAINVISRAPQFNNSGYLDVAYGNYDALHATGALNLGLSKIAALRVAGNFVRRDGYFSDGTSDENGEAGRVSLRVEPSTDLKLTLRADYAHQGGRGVGATGLTDAGFAGDPWTGVTDQPFLLACPITDVAFLAPGCQPGQPLPKSNHQDNDFWGVSGQLDLRTPLGVFTVIPGFRSSSIDYISTLAGYFIIEKNKSDQTSVEIRLASDTINFLSYTVGGYFLTEESKGHAQYEAQVQGRVNDQYYRHRNETAAVFGQLTARLGERLRATAGGRWTYEKKKVDDRSEAVTYFQPDGSPPYSGPPAICFPGTVKQADGTCRLFATLDSDTWKKASWKLGLEWDVGPRSLVYANVGTGFKAGGYFFGPPGSNTYEPEKVIAYTLGAKNKLFDNRLRLNGEAFLLKYRDQQIAGVLTQVGPAIVSRIVNAGQSTAYGAEVEADFLATPNTLLSTQLQYLHARYDDYVYSITNPGFLAPPASGCAISPPPVAPPGTNYTVDCSGFPQLQSPRWVIQTGVQQTIPLANGSRIVLSVNSQYQSSRFTHSSYLPQTKAGDFTQTDAEIRYDFGDGRFSLSGFVRNLENNTVIAQAQPAFGYVLSPPARSGGVHFFTASLRPPRTYGFGVKAKF